MLVRLRDWWLNCNLRALFMLGPQYLHTPEYIRNPKQGGTDAPK